jgi:lipopolysaccharide export LptBFGC system permease protein LptF
METYQIIILALFFGLVVLEILFTNFFSKRNQRTKDGVVELFGFFQLNFLALPLVFGFGYGLAEILLPNSQGLISNWGFFCYIWTSINI